MLRKLVILGVCTGVSASVPTIYQMNPQAFHAMLKAAVDDEPAQEPAPREAAVSAPTGRKVEIPADARGHFLADFKVNGRRVSAMVDTGATYVAVNRSTARSLGVTLTAADFKYTIDTANGTTRAAAAMLANVEIGRIRVTNVEAVVLEDGTLSATLIGMSFLKRLERYGVEDGVLVLSQ